MPKKEIEKTNENILSEGFYDSVELVPQISKSQKKFDEIVTQLKAGKQYVVKAGIARNTVYTLMRKISETAKISVAYGTSKSGQYVVYMIPDIPTQ